MPTTSTARETIVTADEILGTVRPVLDHLERSARVTQTGLPEIPGTVEETVAHVEAHMRAQDRFWARKLAARDVRLADGRLTELQAALAAARTVLADSAPGLRALSETVAERRAALRVLDDAPDPVEDGLIRAQLAVERLRALVRQIEPWLPAAEARTARLAQATLIALRRHQVEMRRARLEELRRQLGALREPDEADTDAAEVLARIEARLGRALPVPTLAWPKSPLGNPELVEPA